MTTALNLIGNETPLRDAICPILDFVVDPFHLGAITPPVSRMIYTFWRNGWLSAPPPCA